jgi:hypothetical protein
VAQRTIVRLTDDLDGTEIRDGKGETVKFALDRQDYEIDLSDRNAKALRDALSKYVGVARRAGGGSGRSGGRGRGSGSSGTSRGQAREYDPKEVRAWAESQGIGVSQRGRVPASLVAQFQEASEPRVTAPVGVA